jgi:hypothetical protein
VPRYCPSLRPRQSKLHVLYLDASQARLSHVGLSASEACIGIKIHTGLSFGYSRIAYLLHAEARPSERVAKRFCKTIVADGGDWLQPLNWSNQYQV